MASSTEDKVTIKRSSSYGLLPPGLSELKLVLLGNNRSLKASVGNLLMGKTEFNKDQKCVKSSGTFHDKPLTVIFTPDLQLNNTSQQELQQFIQNIKDVSGPGPHVFVVVLWPEAFTEQHKIRLESVLQSFSEEAFHQSLVLMFRSGSRFMNIYMTQSHIREMIRRCRYRYLWMDHNDLYKSDLKEFKHKQLFSRITDMLNENKEVYDSFEKEDTGLTFSIRNKPSLNLVLFGRSREGKTSAAKSILGRAKLPAARPGECVIHDGEVCGRRVSLVELPTLSEKTLKTVRQLCLNCLSLCGPEGVHAFILVLPGFLTDEDKEEVDILQKTLGAQVRDFTVGLISLSSGTSFFALFVNFFIKPYIKLDELRQICGGRALCLNIRDSEVIELIDTVYKLAQGGARAYTKDMFLEALIEEAPKSPEMPLRIALIGSESAKRATAETILGKSSQPKTDRTQANTTCEKVTVTRTVHGHTVTLVITPLLSDNSFSDEISNCISQLYPGPHAFLLLLPIGKINKQDQDSLELIKNRLGESATDYVIVVFTGEVPKENYTIKKYIEECDVFVKDLLKECKNRYHVLNTNETNDIQVTELLKKIDKMAQKNSSSCFTQEMFKTKEIKVQLKKALRKIQEKENTFWLKICIFAIVVLFVAIYIETMLF